MRRLALAATALVVAAAAQSSAAAGGTTIGLVATGSDAPYGVDFEQVDTGAPGPSAGDRNISSGALHRWAGRRAGARVGRVELDCTELDAHGRHYLCQVYAFLAGGQIAAEGHLDGPRAVLAVVGGTGSYSGARGELTIRELPVGQKLALVYNLTG